jgi:hypothetical protein
MTPPPSEPPLGRVRGTELPVEHGPGCSYDGEDGQGEEPGELYSGD